MKRVGSGLLRLGRNGSTGGNISSTALIPSADCFSIIGMTYRVTAILRPSIAANRTPPTKAFLPADLSPPRMARMPNKNQIYEKLSLEFKSHKSIIEDEIQFINHQ